MADDDHLGVDMMGVGNNLFGGQTASASRVVYALIGLAALWCISLLFRDRGEVDET